MTSIRRPSKMEFVMASVCVGAAKPDVAELKTASVKRRFGVYHGRGAGKARWRLCKAADINDPRIIYRNPYLESAKCYLHHERGAVVMYRNI